jgi:thiamine pyrophosphokinase
MRTAIFSGGTIDPDTVLPLVREGHPDYVIAADRGILFCHRYGIRPDRIVGDFDSLSEADGDGAAELLARYRSEGVPIDRFNPVKDTTDTAIALDRAMDAGADEVWFFGATGTRVDHSLSNIFDLYRLHKRGITGVIMDAHNRITMPVGTEMEITRAGQYGNRLSLFPVRGEVTGVTLEGTKYPLHEADLIQGDGGLTVSNEITADVCSIHWKSGTLLVMETKD